MDWLNATGAIGSTLGGICAAVMLILYFWPSIKSRLNSGQKGRPQGLRVILVFLTISFILSAISIYGVWHKRVPDYTHWTNLTQDTVNNRTFENEIVDLDGKKFDHCTFKNVRLRFQGTAPTDFAFCQFQGNWALDTNNIVIADYERLSKFLKENSGNGNFSTGCRDEHGNLNPCP